VTTSRETCETKPSLAVGQSSLDRARRSHTLTLTSVGRHWYWTHLVRKIGPSEPDYRSDYSCLRTSVPCNFSLPTVQSCLDQKPAKYKKACAYASFVFLPKLQPSGWPSPPPSIYPTNNAGKHAHAPSTMHLVSHIPSVENAGTYLSSTLLP
jgi:hypothetical protein